MWNISGAGIKPVFPALPVRFWTTGPPGKSWVLCQMNWLSVQFSSVAHSCPTLATPGTAACQASLSITNSWSLLKPMSIELVMPSSHLILCRLLLLLPSIPPSIRVFSNESVLHIKWPKYWSFSFNISPSNEHSGLNPFRIDWLDLLSVRETSQESSPAPQSKRINFSTVSLLYGPILTSIHDYWKDCSFDYMDLVSKVLSLLFNMLCRLVIDFLPRSRWLLIPWLQSPSAVILEPKKIKSVTVSIFSPIYLPWSDGTGCRDLNVLNVEF